MSILSRGKAHRLPHLIVLGAALLIAVALIFALLPKRAEVTVRMAIPARARSAPFYVALEKGFFHAAGIRAELTAPGTGHGGLQMLEAGNTDLVATAGSSVIDAILHGQSLWILAAVSHADRHVGLVAPATITHFAQLHHKRIAVTPGTTSDLFLRTMLWGAGLTPGDVTIVALQPDEMAQALGSGAVDAASNFEPFLAHTARALPEARILYAHGNFLDYWLAIAAPALVRSTPEIVPRILAALVQAVHYIHAHPEESKQLVSRHLRTPQNDWDLYNFRVHLDNLLLRTMTTNARLLQSHGQPLPDFQHYYYYQGLQAVAPSAPLPTSRLEVK